MPARKQTPKSDEEQRQIRPATDPTDREKQLISQAVDLAEKQIQAGTASSQVITHYLKLGSTTELAQQEKLQNEIARLKAQVAHYESQTRAEDLMAELLGAMRVYSGKDDEE